MKARQLESRSICDVALLGGRVLPCDKEGEIGSSVRKSDRRSATPAWLQAASDLPIDGGPSCQDVLVLPPHHTD
jgi:hypothetical protein